MLQATRKHPCKCFICKEIITTKEHADKVQRNKVECWGFKQVRKANG